MMPEVQSKNMPQVYTIRVLDDGKFVMSDNEGEYGYDNADDLLTDLKDDLSGTPDQGADDAGENMNSKKDKVKKIMGGQDENA